MIITTIVIVLIVIIVVICIIITSSSNSARRLLGDLRDRDLLDAGEVENLQAYSSRRLGLCLVTHEIGNTHPNYSPR